MVTSSQFISDPRCTTNSSDGGVVSIELWRRMRSKMVLSMGLDCVLPIDSKIGDEVGLREWCAGRTLGGRKPCMAKVTQDERRHNLRSLGGL